MSDAANSPRRSKLNVERLEDRTVPTFLPRVGPGLLSPAFFNSQPFPPVGQGGESIAIGTLFPGQNQQSLRSQYVVGTGPGVVGTISVYDTNGTQRSQFVPFAGFKGGINVAVGDVLGLGSQQIIATEAAGGVPIVGVFSPSGEMLQSFFVNGNTTFSGGLNVAAGHVLGGIGGFRFNDTQQFPDQIIIGAASVLPAVVVTDGYGNVQQAFMAFSPDTGVGVTVAAADVDTGPSAGAGGGFGGGGFGGGRGRTPDTNAYEEIIVGAASKLPGVGVFDVWTGSVVQRALYLAFDPTIPGNAAGVTVAAGTTDGFRGAQVYVNLIGSSTIRVFNGSGSGLITQFDAFPAGYSGVVNMAIGHVANPFDPFNNNFNNFDSADLAVVAGDGPFFQEPRIFFGSFFGAPGTVAGTNGP